MFKNISLFLLRIGMGVLFLLAGYAKIINPNWSAAGYIAGSKIFTGFFSWLLTPNILPIINFLNVWGLTLVGLALILGIFIRLASFFGITLMVFYYLPIYPSAHGLIDEHIIYSLVFLIFMAFGGSDIFSLRNWVQTRLHPAWHKWVK
ncbi:MAG: DoxX family membrane protein [Candidatus Azambacteria bacterium]|nr:DoxX family membrane protein [Candidatus Azambacteria bacterium]